MTKADGRAGARQVVDASGKVRCAQLAAIALRVVEFCMENGETSAECAVPWCSVPTRGLQGEHRKD